MSDVVGVSRVIKQRSKRSRVKVVFAILDYVYCNRNVRVTKMMYKVGTDYFMFVGALDLLVEKGFLRVSERDGCRYFSITREGVGLRDKIGDVFFLLYGERF